MDFQNLKSIENYQFYIDLAFKRASKNASDIQNSFKGKKINALTKSKISEKERINSVYLTLNDSFKNILKSFPQLDQLDPFYLQLVKISVDYDKLKIALGSFAWFIKNINKLYLEHKLKINHSNDPAFMIKLRNQFYARISSFLKQLKEHLEYAEQSRKKMKDFPPIKTSIATIVIAGFPNVGKSTLLKAITGSAPKIAPYPFTTQKLMIGYNPDKTLQFIDTPGLLDRDLKKRNNIELQAVLALKYLAKRILFVFDPSERCGYTWEEQKNLFEDIKTNFDIQMLVAFNKIDICESEIIQKRLNEFGKDCKVFLCSGETNAGIDGLKREFENNVAE